jgi:hypothetical protein
VKEKKGGNVPVKAVDWALQHCYKYLRCKNHEDLDRVNTYFNSDNYRVLKLLRKFFPRWYSGKVASLLALALSPASLEYSLHDNYVEGSQYVDPKSSDA